MHHDAFDDVTMCSTVSSVWKVGGASKQIGGGVKDNMAGTKSSIKCHFVCVFV